MGIQNLLNQFMGTGEATALSDNASQGIGGTLSQLAGNIPGGLAGGAAAGGIMALLMTNKTAREFAGTAATYGGAALLGGLAYKAYRNWKQNGRREAPSTPGAQRLVQRQQGEFRPPQTLSEDFQLRLIKAMVAAAKADGHIDANEQQRIFAAVEQMELSPELKAYLFDLLRQPIAIEEIAYGVELLEEKSELYLASCLVSDPDHPAEQAHLNELANALALPPGLPEQLRWQAQQAMDEAG